MKRHTFKISILFCVTVLSSCDSFEDRFYAKIEQGQINAVNHGSDTFDLSSVTDFTWDSVLLIRGDESVPTYNGEIEKILNGGVSKIRREDEDFGDKNDQTVRYRAEDLPTATDRFYFLTPNKTIETKDIEHNSSQRPEFDVKYCLADSTSERNWLARQECKFILKANMRTIGDGTIFLFPQCETRFSPTDIKLKDE